MRARAAAETGLRALAPRFAPRALDLQNGFAEIVDALEIFVHRGEADVGDVVHFLQFPHHQLAEGARLDLALSQREDARFDAVDGIVDVVGRHRTLVQRAHEAGPDFFTVVGGAVAVRLDHRGHRQFHPLVGGEAFAAFLALAPTAHAGGVFRQTRVDDRGIVSLAERTFHELGMRGEVSERRDMKMLRGAIADPQEVKAKFCAWAWRGAPCPAYTGNWWHKAWACASTRFCTASLCGASRTSAIRLASCSDSARPKPRLVIAGLPMRMPLVTVGFCGSLGIAFLLTVTRARPSASSASRPVMFFARRSTRNIWQSVPPETMRTPRSCSTRAMARALAMTCA